MSWRCLEDVLKTYDKGKHIHFYQDVLETSWRGLLKTKTKCIFKTSVFQISNWVSLRVRPRSWYSTLFAIALIWSSVSSLHGLIPSMRRHAWRWYWWRLSIFCPSKEFVFFYTASSLFSFSTFSSRAAIRFKSPCCAGFCVWSCDGCWKDCIMCFSCFLFNFRCHIVCLV